MSRRSGNPPPPPPNWDFWETWECLIFSFLFQHRQKQPRCSVTLTYFSQVFFQKSPKEESWVTLPGPSPLGIIVSGRWHYSSHESLQMSHQVPGQATWRRVKLPLNTDLESVSHFPHKWLRLGSGEGKTDPTRSVPRGNFTPEPSLLEAFMTDCPCCCWAG